jgi:hypothetical protein
MSAMDKWIFGLLDNWVAHQSNNPTIRFIRVYPRPSVVKSNPTANSFAAMADDFGPSAGSCDVSASASGQPSGSHDASAK